MSDFLGQGDLEDVPFAVREDMGPLRVWYRGVLLREFPWHSHWNVDRSGKLRILDVPSGRWVGNYAAGNWTDCNRRSTP